MKYKLTKTARRIGLVIATVIVTMAMAIPANAANMIDISDWQRGINITTTGADIVVVKATESTTYVNTDCDRVVQQALSTDKGVGVYHFANTRNDPLAEADFFVQQTKGYIGKGIVPILDWEPGGPGNIAWALTWLNRVESRWGAKPIIYMSQNTENKYDWTPVVQQNYGLWIAAYTLGFQPIYGFNPPNAQPVMKHWPFAVAWQYTSSGHVNGWPGNVDLSVVYGSIDTWRAYASGTGTIPAPPYPPKVTTPSSPSVDGTDEQLADRVIRGEFGSIPERQRRLGSRYAAVQAIVNARLGQSGAGAASGVCVVVRSGDTLSGIAARTGKTPYTMWGGYRSGNPNRLYAGETVCYRGANTGNQSSGGHVVRAGESLWAIYGSGWANAAARNGIRAPYVIHPGQVLR